MVTRLTRITPVQLGIVSAALYALIGLIKGIAIALASLAGRSAGAAAVAGIPLQLGWLSIIIFPVALAILGFVGGIIYAWIYNLIARWTGGVEFTLESRQPVNIV